MPKDFANNAYEDQAFLSHKSPFLSFPLFFHCFWQDYPLINPAKSLSVMKYMQILFWPIFLEQPANIKHRIQ